MTHLKHLLPDWALPWIEFIAVGLQIALIVLLALLVRSLLHRFINRLGNDNHLPAELVVGGRRLVSILVFGAALLWVLDRLGVSGMVLWTAFTGFAAVAAVAFFAAWSVLSNIFCSILIYTTRPFGLTTQQFIEPAALSDGRFAQNRAPVSTQSYRPPSPFGLAGKHSPKTA